MGKQKRSKNIQYRRQKQPPLSREQEKLHLQILRQALAFHAQGDIKQALDAYDQAIRLKSDFAISHNGRGALLKMADRCEEALDAFERAIAIDPAYADAHYHRGVVMQKLERYSEAVASFDRAIAVNPAYAAAHNDRAAALHSMGKYEEALASWERAAATKPGYADAHFNLGLALKQAGRLEEALADFNRAIASKPSFTDAHFNRGVILQKLRRYEEAISSFDRVIEIEPTRAEAHFNHGFALQELTRYQEALLSYERALVLKNDYPAALWNKSLLLLLNGDYEEGWRLYERRHDVMKQFTRNFDQPLLDLRHEESNFKTVLLYAEQGLGDTIQMMRYIPLLAARGFGIIAELPDSLLPLAKALPGIEHVISHGKALPDFDRQCPFMSLPLVFQTTLETIPAAVPYLTTPPGKTAFWKERLGERTRPRVGLIWSGSKDHENDHERSIPLATLLTLLDRDAEFHSIQKEYRCADTEILTITRDRLRDHAEDILDFGDTAALIEEMDLIISVDTAGAHLAGALGKPVWILLPYANDFRWLVDRQDSPWYPTARLFRAPAFHSWQPVLDQLNSLLDKTIRGVNTGACAR